MVRSGRGTRRWRHLPAIAAATGALLVPVRGATAGPDPELPSTSPTTTTVEAEAPEQIEPVEVDWLNGRLVELTFDNPRLDPPLRETKVRILVPNDFETSGARYPVVLLLHGVGDTSSAWTTNRDGFSGTVEDFTADKDVIVVMPDGGSNADAGWYTDWFNDGAFGSPQWATYHLVQLLDYVDRAFPTRTDRNGRVVAGLSMGGFGAMSYAARHPDLFAGAFSFSGALDNEAIGTVVDDRIWGPRSTHEVRHRGHNPVDLAENLADTEVWFRIGMGLPGGPAPKDDRSIALEAALWPTNERFARALDAAGVEYTYRTYPMGGHNWYHWQQGFRLAWPEMEALFDSVAEPPRSFDYRSIDSAFSVWGWDVAVDRAVTEFLELREVSDAGLTLRGSGSVSVTTPPSYRPHALHRIAISSDSDETASFWVQADDAGRLRFDVGLGPSHTLQQYTPAQRAAAASDPGYMGVAEVRIAPLAVQ